MFANKNLSVIAYANGFTLWHYKDPSLSYEKVNPDNFFNQISTLCSVGDKFMVNTKDYYAEFIVVSLGNRSVKCKVLSKLEIPGTSNE